MILPSKYFRLQKLLLTAVFLFTILCIQPDILSAQGKYSYKYQTRFDGGRYHSNKAWVHSGGFSISPFVPFFFWYNLTDGIGQTLPLQFEYIGYKQKNSILGLGLSISLTMHPTGELGYEYFTHFKFVDIAMYSKLNLNDSRRRLYVDSKLGFGIAIDNAIGFGCFGCASQRYPLYLRYTSGPMVQPGIGLDFATAGSMKWGIKLSYSANFVRMQRDLHHDRWKTTPEGILKRSTSTGVLQSIFLGFNFYI